MLGYQWVGDSSAQFAMSRRPQRPRCFQCSGKTRSKVLQFRCHSGHFGLRKGFRLCFATHWLDNAGVLWFSYYLVFPSEKTYLVESAAMAPTLWHDLCHCVRSRTQPTSRRWTVTLSSQRHVGSSGARRPSTTADWGLRTSFVFGWPYICYYILPSGQKLWAYVKIWPKWLWWLGSSQSKPNLFS